jgi:quinol monooxygenase YgiN
MTVIFPGKQVYTLINVFTVDPEDQQRLVDILVETAERWVKHLPGFISASFHKSLDGTKVTNYEQWKDRKSFELMLLNPAIRERLLLTQEIGQADGHFYSVAFVSEATKR